MEDTTARTFESAINTLKHSVSPADAAAFQSTTAEEVWKAVEDIQNEQRKRQSLRNIRRVEPFLKSLEKYSKVIEVVCNGTPYLPWIWAPIKLMLQIADEYANAFDKLLDAYAQIAEHMPHLHRVVDTFKDDPNFKVVVGMVFADILEFHRRAYKFLRRRSWQIFFDSLWKSFELRFKGILQRLTDHQNLLMKEVNTINAIEARQWRIKAEEWKISSENDIARREKQTRDFHIHDSIAWLKVADEQNDDELERLSSKRQEGTCEWVFSNPLFQRWKDDGHEDPVLWVKGIPGAGKTILSTYVIHRLQEETGFTTAYHICNHYTTGKSLLGEILRSVIVQFLRGDSTLAPYVFENYANKGLAPSIVRVKRLLSELVLTIPRIRIIVDGLDEYPEGDQRNILSELLALTKTNSGQCRILFSNREGGNIDKALSSKPTISLRDQYKDVKKDIEAYVHTSLEDFRMKFDDSLIDEIEKRIVDEADGMFLWVRLVMKSLENCHSRQELQQEVNSLPSGLDKAYGRILDRVMNDLSAQAREKAIRILEWIACSFRIMKAHEICDGILFHDADMVLDEHTKLIDNFLDICKPLIEEGPKNTIDFVHYSAKEYILHKASGPFLKYDKAHYDLAFSCINYMNSASCFIEGDEKNNDLKIRVLKGYHGLHHYANEYWFQHLLQYAKCDSIDNEELDDELDDPLENIKDFWKQRPGEGAKSLKLEDTTSADNIQLQLESLDSLPLAQKMGKDILTFAKFLSQEKYSHQDPESLKNEERKFDPTRFSEVSQLYQNIVRSLVNCSADDCPSGAEPHELEKFKRIYLDSAFICRYRECPRYSNGFTTSAERDAHEARHTKPLRCSDPSCDFFARGFTSKTGLMKHNRKYHPLPEEMELPDFEPRKEPEPVFIPPPPAPPPAPVAPPVQQRAPTPPPQSPEVEQEEEQPRAIVKKGRMSRAKKGKPVHECNQCSKVYSRNEWLQRHKLIHGDPKFTCRWKGCGRQFYRSDLLDRHHLRHEKMGVNAHISNSQIVDSGGSTPQPNSNPSSQASGTAMSVQALLNSTLSNEAQYI